MREAELLAHDLREAYAVAGPALCDYARALATARSRLPDFVANSSAANLIIQYVPGMAAESWDTVDSANWIFLGDSENEHEFKLSWI